MLSVPAAVLTALNAKSRQIKVKAIIYFSSPLTVTGTNYLVDFDSLEEEYTDSSEIFGMMSSNECSIKLLNTNRIFSVTNTSSPYYGQLKPGLKVEVIVEVFTTTWVEVPLGTFYSVEWPMGTTGTFVEVLCRDRLYTENKKPVSAIPVQTNITVKKAIEDLFDNAGVTGYTVDATLTYQIPYWCHKDSTLGEALQKFVTGYGVRIYANKVDGIVAKKTREAASVSTLTGSNQIMSLKGASDARYVFSEVNVDHIKKVVEDNTYLYELLAGSNELVTFLATVLVKATKSNSAITSLSFDCSKITVTVAAITDLELVVDALKIENLVTVRADAGLVAAYGTITKRLRTEIAQSDAEVNNLAQAALNDVRVEKVIMLEVRGNVALELGDKVTVNNNATATTGDYHITKMKHEFSGSLKGTYTLLKS